LERASPWAVISSTSTPGATARCHSRPRFVPRTPFSVLPRPRLLEEFQDGGDARNTKSTRRQDRVEGPIANPVTGQDRLQTALVDRPGQLVLGPDAYPQPGIGGVTQRARVIALKVAAY